MLRPAPLFLALSLAVALFVTLGTRAWHASPPEAVIVAADIQVSNEQFGSYINEWSEPEGFFDSDNFISNETSYLHVVNELQDRVRPGGVYLGVGPDQNFSYIAHTRPALAVIVDIRRQNMLEHLLYKALFELSSSRAEFLSMLFSRKEPEISRDADLPSLLRAIRSTASSPEVYEANLGAIKDLLLTKHALDLSQEDLVKITYVYETFWREGLDLRFSTIGRGNALQYPTYENLMLETDLLGNHQNYLTSDELFQWMKRFQSENRLIPVVGDFSGSHAFKTIARFLTTNGLSVSTFYTSNVEFYLFGRPAWTAYMDNVRSLPAAADSVFIRAYFSTYGRPHPQNVPGNRSTTLVHDFLPFVADYVADRIPTYWEVVNR